MSKEKESRSAVSAGIGYTIGNILIKGINFLSVPLFSRIMTPDELGVYSAFVAYDSILFVILSLAIHSSVKNAKYTFSGEVDEYTSSVSLILWMNMAIGLIVATIFRPVIKLTWAAGCLSLFAGVHEFWLVGAKSL